jgi:hypothetical protein
MLDACPDVAGVKTDDSKTTGCPAQAVALPAKKSVAPAAIPLVSPTTAVPAPSASAAPAPETTNNLAPEPPKKTWWKPWTWFN